MCRISGFWDFRPSVEYDRRKVLENMRDSLAYGGPDAAGLYEDEFINLGHRRLSILDLSEAGNQPFHYEEFVIVFNGEVYNFQEIKNQLLALGINFHTETDTEVILKAFLEWREEAVHRFRGMFAFAIWHKTEKKLWLFRDRVGVKPLYWYWKDGLFMFASELKAFPHHPDFDKSLHMPSVSYFLQRGYISSPYSIFSHVKKVSPGHYLTLDIQGEPSVHCYWDANQEYQRQDLSGASHEEIQKKLETLLRESFLLRMVADVPVGMFLSGGIDSSLVTALIQDQVAKPVKTFTIGFNQPEFDESPHAEAIAKHLGTDHHTLICSERDFQEIIPQLPDLYDEPFGDSSAIPTFLVSKFAKKEVKVSLSADGGDELFGGYTKYEATQNFYPKIQKIPRAIRNYASSFSTRINPNRVEAWSSQLPYLKNYAGVSNKLHKFLRALPANSSTDFFLQSSTYFSPSEIQQFLPQSAPSSLFTHPGIASPGREISFLGLLDIQSYLEADIMTKVDRATMRVALEGREPFLDHHLIEFSLGIPDHLKISGNNTKILLREILYRYVPKSIIDRPKQGFAIPVEKWLKNHLATQLLSICQDTHFIAQFGFDGKVLTTYIQTFLNGKPYRNPHGVWFLFVLHQWYKKWLA